MLCFIEADAPVPAPSRRRPKKRSPGSGGDRKPSKHDGRSTKEKKCKDVMPKVGAAELALWCEAQGIPAPNWDAKGRLILLGGGGGGGNSGRPTTYITREEWADQQRMISDALGVAVQTGQSLPGLRQSICDLKAVQENQATAQVILSSELLEVTRRAQEKTKEKAATDQGDGKAEQKNPISAPATSNSTPARVSVRFNLVNGVQEDTGSARRTELEQERLQLAIGRWNLQQQDRPREGPSSTAATAGSLAHSSHRRPPRGPPSDVSSTTDERLQRAYHVWKQDRDEERRRSDRRSRSDEHRPRVVSRMVPAGEVISEAALTPSGGQRATAAVRYPMVRANTAPETPRLVTRTTVSRDVRTRR